MKKITVVVYVDSVEYDRKTFTSDVEAAGWASDYQDRGFKVRVQ